MFNLKAIIMKDLIGILLKVLQRILSVVLKSKHTLDSNWEKKNDL